MTTTSGSGSKWTGAIIEEGNFFSICPRCKALVHPTQEADHDKWHEASGC